MDFLFSDYLDGTIVSFNPATDQNGQPTSGSFSQRITWRIQ